MKRKYAILLAIVIFLITGLLCAIFYFSPKPAMVAGADHQNVYTHHKVIPVILQKEITAALSFYPELRETPIHFILDPNTSKSIMLSQPVAISFVKGQQNREYVVKINPRFSMVHDTLLIQNVPTDILIGWFGHELGHILDYTNRSNAQMIVFGIKYVASESFLRQAEINADTYAVDHGLGEYIIKTKNFILNNAGISPQYKARIKRLYLSPQQIIDMVKKLKAAPKV
jgi:hypothetical protein